MTAVLELRGVTKRYGEQEVLRGIDLAVGEHEAIALIGASGSGKSTLLRCIDLLEEIDDGDVLLDGEVITDPAVDPVAVRRRLGMVFQAFNLFPHLTVLENVVLAPVRAHAERAAALALGLTGRQALRFVVLPQAVRRVVPPLLNDFISLQKDVALVSILGPLEAFRVAQIAASSNFEYTPLVAAALLYLCVTIPLARVVDRMSR